MSLKLSSKALSGQAALACCRSARNSARKRVSEAVNSMIEAVVNNGTSGVALAFVTTPTAPTVFTPPAVIRAVPGIAVPLTIILGVNVISSLAQQTAVLEALAGLSALLDHATDDDPCQECIEKRVWGQDSNRQMVDLPPTRLRRP